MSQRDSIPRSMSRRDFARRAVLTAGAAAFVPRLIEAADIETPAPAKNAPAPAPAPPPPSLSPALQAEAEARIEAVLRRYGARLSAAQKTEVRRLVMQSASSLEPFRAFKLENWDEPATVLRLVRREV